MTELITDPEQVNKLVASAFKAVGSTEVVTQTNTVNEVVLPAGLISKDGSLHKLAQIRELNGLDEEALAKAGSPTRALYTAFTRGLVSIGDKKPTDTELDSLLNGDREAILLGIRIATFGSSATYSIYCGGCGTQQSIEVDLEKDIEIKNLEDPLNDRSFGVDTKAGEAIVTFPNGLTQKKLFDSENKTTAEVITEILAGCIASIDGEPSLGRSTALSLGMADREAIVSKIYELSPGPRLGEVKKACEACGNELELSLSLADLFRLQAL
jgi:hypothetical protein